MMCKECHSWPHLPGCPEGPEAVLTTRCEECGRIFHPDDLTVKGGRELCVRCLKEEEENG